MHLFTKHDSVKWQLNKTDDLRYCILLATLIVIHKKYTVSFTKCKLNESVIQPLIQMNKKSKIIRGIDQQCRIL